MKVRNEEEKFEWITTAPIPGLVARLSVPTIISMLVTSLYNMADTYFVGTLGTSEQGAVGVVFSLMAIIQAIGFTFGNGSGNTISRLLGAQDHAEAEKVAAVGFFTAIATGVLLAVFGIIFSTPLVRALGATDTILPYAKDYASVILIGAPWMIGSCVLNNQHRFAGNANFAMIGIATGAVLNIGLDPLFIIVFKMGIKGAALATIISQFVSFLLLLSNVGKAGSMPIRFKNFVLSGRITWEILKCGFPSLCRQGLASLATILLNWAAKPFGDAAIAAMAIVNKVTHFCGSAVTGFGQGFQPICGFNYGAKKYDRVREGFWFCVKIGASVMGVLAIAVLFIAPQIAYAFQRNDPRVVELATYALRLHMLSMPLVAYVMVNNMLLQTVGEAGRATVLAMSRQGLFYIPLILVLPRIFGLLGMMLCQPISDLCTFILTIPLSVSFLNKMKRQEAGA